MANRESIIKLGPNRVWRTYRGGKRLDAIQGKSEPEDSHFPEDWIGSTVEARNPGRDVPNEGLAMLVDSNGQETSLKSLIEADPIYFLGSDEHGHRSLDDMPLVKYLDSATRLHFQAHPTSEFAQQRLNAPRGKTEAYVILDIRDEIEEPYIYAGFQRAPSREQLKHWILDQDIEAIEERFDKIPVKVGDVFLITGGRPHALGEGILMLEIMEPSDLAVRFEFEREGFVIPEKARFMGRDLETALDVFSLDSVSSESINSVFRCEPAIIEVYGGRGHWEELIGSSRTSCFTVRKTCVLGTIFRKPQDYFIGIVVSGGGKAIADGQYFELKQWDRFFCPNGVVTLVYESSEEMTVLECSPGGER
ncbi:MAG: class I mannose-6-phosphate isomerase [Opitutales bacterium]|jgi:mannose-6-phosphate isomerase|nr:class I mannose-6-phosphate isomerase [Opitutales bacterium]MBT5169377.1 class I mannose-6-phosphate isomerase [Opitutales bacterium]MBT5815350.1 class I mannose-6-phosphate isomerase [Opitutales bacterium]